MARSPGRVLRHGHLRRCVLSLDRAQGAQGARGDDRERLHPRRVAGLAGARRRSARRRGAAALAVRPNPVRLVGRHRRVLAGVRLGRCRLDRRCARGVASASSCRSPARSRRRFSSSASTWCSPASSCPRWPRASAKATSLAARWRAARSRSSRRCWHRPPGTCRPDPCSSSASPPRRRQRACCAEASALAGSRDRRTRARRPLGERPTRAGCPGCSRRRSGGPARPRRGGLG